jgi:hypothetical protein
MPGGWILGGKSILGVSAGIRQVAELDEVVNIFL